MSPTALRAPAGISRAPPWQAWTRAPPVDPDRFDAELTPIERAELEHVFSSALVGSASTVQRGLTEFLDRTAADEIIISGQIYDHGARLRSFELIAELRQSPGQRDFDPVVTM